MKLETRRFFRQLFDLEQTDEAVIVIGFVSYQTLSSPIAHFETGSLFTETLDSHCFRDSVKSGRTIRCLIDHDPTKVLGSTSKGNLEIFESESGIRFELRLDPEADADVIQAIHDREFGGVSPSFEVVRDRWPSEDYRIIERAELFELSLVTHAAYKGSSACLQAKRTFPEPELAPNLYKGLTRERRVERKLR